MKAFVVVNKKQEILDGLFDFNLLETPFPLHLNLVDAFSNIQNSDQCVMEIIFQKPEEILNGLNNLLAGNAQSKFTVKWITAYTKTEIK